MQYMASDSMPDNITDRRKYPRYNVEKVIFIEVVDSGSRTEAQNTIIRCETLDISAGGLRAALPTAIPQGSLLNIAVPMEDWQENLELSAEAMWVKESERGEGYWVGLALKDSNREDMEKWYKVVQKFRGQS
jgi:c-di-GMP-binding flagellar brake protein YcgR